MQISARLPIVLVLSSLISPYSSGAQKKLAWAQRILSAKTVYFDNETGSDTVGKKALVRLKNWGRFHVVPDRKQADLIFLLSSDPYNGGNIILSGGQTGSVDNRGHIERDSIPNYNKRSPTRYAYLTVIDAGSGESVWSEEHVWGGLLTGFNSVGSRLVGDLERQTKK
jgi:hypothetical protein